MEGGAVSLELTFREATPEPGAAAHLQSGSRSPKPRTGWYSRRSKRSSAAGRGSAKGSTAAGWASTDAEHQALRWHRVGSCEIPAFETCTLLPWLGGSVKRGQGDEAAVAAGAGQRGLGSGCGLGGAGSAVTDGRWAEMGLYPPGDGRRRREALLLGFHSAEASFESSQGYVVALLVEAGAQGGVSVAEICRSPLEAGHQPVSFNVEKIPPGAPTSGRANAEAVCADGWVRRWCLACSPPASARSAGNLQNGQASFALSRIDICHPFRGLGGEHSSADGVSRGSAVASPAALIAVASPTLLAVARSSDPRRPRPPSRSFRDVPQPASSSSAAAAAFVLDTDAQPAVEVWSCSKTPYPGCSFKKEGTVALPALRIGQAVEGMCWVSPEAGDERGAAISGHCLCVSVGGCVTVLARERGWPPSALSGLVLAPEVAAGTRENGEDWTWSPVFRVANPSLLLSCRTAGLRDFCQVRARGAGRLATMYVCGKCLLCRLVTRASAARSLP